jgi:D-alanine-D-alanine ligase
MDKRAITSDRIRSLDDELELKQNLAEIAQKIYQNLYLNTLIRVDLRADQNDTLQVLEANPKPDLKRPDSTVTSLVAQGLNSYGMSYEDLILTLLSDRLNYLITYHSKTIQHIVEMID